jgi:putative ATP-binding cassette transporter
LIAAAIVGSASGLASVGLLALINATLTRQGSVSLGLLAFGFIGLCLVVTVARISTVYLLSRLGQDLVLDLRVQLSRRILSAPLRRLEELGSHRLLASLTDDVGALTQGVMTVPMMVINSTIILGCFTYLAWLDWKLFLMLLGVVVVGVVSYQFPAQLGIGKFRVAREEQDTLFDHFRALTGGVKELKLHRARRGSFIGRLVETAGELRNLRISASMIYGAAAAWGHLLFFVVIGSLLYARPSWLTVEWNDLVAYTIVMLYLMTPLQTLLDAIPNLGRADVGVAKVEALGFALSANAEALEADEIPEEPVPTWSRLELDGAVHTYRREGQDRDFQLGPIDFHVEPGEVVFLVGGNGSGKTTLAKMILGLYPPLDGMVRLDGEQVTPANLEEFRQMFSTVFDDFHLFEEFLGFEGRDIDDEAARYLDELRLSHKVTVSDGRLSTTDLSQGQRKRLALLTAYLEDRPIYLFDEWAADQDPVFKEIFYRQILGQLRARGKAVVVISHDDRYFDAADRLYKLEDGKIRLEVDHPVSAASAASADDVRPVEEVAPVEVG